MAKTSLVIKCERKKKKYLEDKKAGKKPVMPTRIYNRCQVCGRPRGYFRRFGMCRICLRQLASQDLIMGLRKSSW